MQSKKISPNIILIRLARGEYINQSLALFCQQNHIEGGFFYGLGASDETELALYDVAKKKYFSKKFENAFEISNLTGTIAVEKELIIHTHATVADEKFTTYAGHLVDARISGTCEIYLTVLPKLTKEYDAETGLKIFNLDK